MLCPNPGLQAHLFFDYLAFKNDVGFFKNRKDYTGISGDVGVGLISRLRPFRTHFSAPRRRPHAVPPPTMGRTDH